MTKSQLGRIGVAVATAFVPITFLGLFVLWPLASVVYRSLAGADIGQLVETIGRPAIGRVLWFTLWQAALSAALTVVLGLPVAHVIARHRFAGARALRVLVLVPFVLPTVVVAAAIRSMLQSLLGSESTTVAPVVGVLVAHVFFNLAVVVRVVGGSWSQLDDRQAQVAATLGASPLRTWWTVTMRQLAPAVAASALLVFLFSFTSFGVIRVLGGLRTATIETEIYRYAVARGEFDVAAILALIQIVVVALAAALAARLQRGASTAGTVTTEVPNRGANLESWSWGLLRLHLMYRTVVVGITVIVIGLPLAALIEGSLRVGGGYGLTHYRALGTRVDVLPVTGVEALTLSLLIGLTASVVSVAVGLPAAALIAAQGKIGKVVQASLALPIGVSAVTLGFGYLVGLRLFDLRQWVGLIPLAHAVIGLPFVVAGLVVTLRAINPRMREAAATLGASPLQVRRTVDGPLTRPAILTGAAFSAAVSFGEFGATSFLGRTDGSFTAPLAIFRLLSSPGELLRGQALALSVVVGVMVVLVAGAVEIRFASAASGSRG